MEFFQSSLLGLIFWLFVGHAIADYALQSDFIAQAKNPKTEVGETFWPWVSGAHALIHGGFVALFTGYWILGLLEVIIHWATDMAKCENAITFKQDQLVHYGCKVVWAIIVFSI